MKLPKVATSGTVTSITVNDAVFAAQVNPVLLAQAVRVYLSNKRQGTSKVQTRSAVSRTKAKLYRQKGTGNARHGSRNAPIFVGGGVAHGPNGEQNWTLQLPKTMKRQALACALTVQNEHMQVVDKLAELDGKTKTAAAAIAPLVEKNDRVLVILPEAAQESARSLYNLSQVMLVLAERVTAYQVLSADKILLHPDTIGVLELRAVRAPKATASSKAVSPVEPVAKATKQPVAKKEVVQKAPAKKTAVKKTAAKTPAKKTTKAAK